jgi:hypothetical protein
VVSSDVLNGGNLHAQPPSTRRGAAAELAT